MAKLHKHELDYKEIAREVLLKWLPLLLVWLAYEFQIGWLSDCRKTVEAHWWLQNLIPLPKNAGWGTLSFVSTVTGLNLAIVKFQSFLKTQEESQSRWTIEGIKNAIESKPELLVDEPTAELFKQAVRERSRRYVDEINLSNLKHWAMWNRWAVRATIVGMLCLIFGYSAGFLIPVMLAPVIATWILGRLTSEKLFNKIDVICDIAAHFVSTLRRQSDVTETTVTKSLKEEASKLPFSNVPDRS